MLMQILQNPKGPILNSSALVMARPLTGDKASLESNVY